MAVFEYREGEHPGGFVGFRVARTIGGEADYRQRYFGTRNASPIEYNLIREQAYALDEEWRQEAAGVLKHKRVYQPGGAVRPPWQIAQGLRAMIDIERKERKGRIQVYWAPAFSAKQPGYGRSAHVYRIPRYGFQQAYRLAVQKYCEIFGYSPDYQLALYARQPDYEIFVGPLLDRMKENGHRVTKKEMRSKLISAGP